MESVRRSIARLIAPVAHYWPIRPLLARPSPRRVVLVAIVKDEFEYLLEWIAWHRARGFSRFIVGDHESEDGSTELLEALDVGGVLERRAVRTHEDRATQMAFYEQVIEDFPRGADPILGFIDADEFVMGPVNDNLARRVARVFRDDSVSALGLSWRIMGSSGYARENAGPVLARFGGHAVRDFEKNRWIKSFIRRSRLRAMEVHHGRLRSGRYVNARGETLAPETPGSLHRTASVCWDELFLGHFVVKSEREFDRKKARKGNPIDGRNVVKGPRYFEVHDRNEMFTPLSRRALRSLMKEQERLLHRLQAHTLYFRPCFGEVQVVEGTGTLQGWLAYAGPPLPRVQVTVRGPGREWLCTAVNDGAWQPPEGGPELPKLAFSLALDELGTMDPAELEIRPYGSCVRLAVVESEVGT